jgi:hypothetical protein
MASLPDDARALLQGSRSVAESADFLSVAVRSGDRRHVEEAVDDLLAAYDGYTGKATAFNSRFGFDEVAKLAVPEERDQGTANSLAGALIDLQVAVVLCRTAQAASETDARVDAGELDEAIATLNETIKAIEGPSGAPPGTTRFAFDEVAASKLPESFRSPDLPSAKATYRNQVKTLYDTLLTETTALLVGAFKEVSRLDADTIGEALKTIVGPVGSLPGGGLAARALDALKRALDTLKGFLGPALVGKIEERIAKIVSEIRKGENPLQVSLKYAYGYDQGQKDIATWLDTSRTDLAAIDKGTQALAELRQGMVQAFTLLKRISAGIGGLGGPLKWILQRFGGTLPIDLLMGGAYFLVIDIALLRGMDYADTSRIFNWVDGVVTISKRTLGAPQGTTS